MAWGNSIQHVKRIRAVHNINNPPGYGKGWTRCIGRWRPLRTHFSHVWTYSLKVGNRDYTKLQELADLLIVVKAAKLEGSLSGLTFLDTSRRANPIVEKLPHYLQEKWLTKGLMYKDCWVGSLSFHSPRQRLPNNREQVLNRLMSLRCTLLKKLEMKDHYMYINFIGKIFNNGHAE